MLHGAARSLTVASPSSEASEDATASGVGKRAEGGVQGGRRIVNHMVYKYAIRAGMSSKNVGRADYRLVRR